MVSEEPIVHKAPESEWNSLDGAFVLGYTACRPLE